MGYDANMKPGYVTLNIRATDALRFSTALHDAVLREYAGFKKDKSSQDAQKEESRFIKDFIETIGEYEMPAYVVRAILYDAPSAGELLRRDSCGMPAGRHWADGIQSFANRYRFYAAFFEKCANLLDEQARESAAMEEETRDE